MPKTVYYHAHRYTPSKWKLSLQFGVRHVTIATLAGALSQAVTVINLQSPTEGVVSALRLSPWNASTQKTPITRTPKTWTQQLLQTDWVDDSPYLLRGNRIISTSRITVRLSDRFSAADCRLMKTELINYRYRIMLLCRDLYDALLLYLLTYLLTYLLVFISAVFALCCCSHRK